MKLETIEIMICPDCKSKFKIEKINKKDENKIIAGIIRCKCYRYPILDEILIYDKNQMLNTEIIMDLLESGDIKSATALPLEGKKLDKPLFYLLHSQKIPSFLKKIINIMFPLILSHQKNRYQEYFEKDITFFNLINQIWPDDWGDYLKHRFSTESLWSIYPFIPVIKEKNDIILDLGCGIGHLAHLVSKNAAPKNLICMDREYTLLRIAKKYLAKDADFICFDLNNALPFKEGVFSSVIMLDSFHYVENRARLANDMEHVLASNGLLLISHLHNSLAETRSLGYALEPTVWKSLFKKLNMKSFPEKELIDELLHKDKLELHKEIPDDVVNKSNANSMIGSNDSGLFKTYDNIQKSLIENYRNLIINPIYNIVSHNGKIILKREIPNEIFKIEYSLTLEYLPESIDLSNSITHILDGRKLRLSTKMDQDLSNKIEELIRKFIIIDVPEGYI